MKNIGEQILDKTMIVSYLAIYTLIILATLGMGFFGLRANNHPN